jgi:hypothetical protein
VWHVSVGGNTPDAQHLMAQRVLLDVGDAEAGEWWETGVTNVTHLRRRLTAAEAHRVGPIKDVRGTVEALRRFSVMKRYLPDGWTEIA